MTTKQYTIQGSRGKYPYHEGKHIIVTIELFAYGDESGIEDSAPYCLLLGFMGSPRQWDTFKKDWRKILNDYEIQEFHAKGFFGRDQHGQRLDHYKDWSSARAHGFLESLVQVASRRRLYPIGGAVDVKAFKSFTQAERGFFTGQLIWNDWNMRKWHISGAPTKPYYFAMKLFVIEALERAEPSASIHFIFDEQNVLQAHAVNTFRDWVSLYHPFQGNKAGIDQFKSIIFTKSGNEAGLQLADMYAYAFNRYIRHLSIDSDVALILKTFTHKDKKKRPGIRVFDKPSLQGLLNNLRQDIREKLKE